MIALKHLLELETFFLITIGVAVGSFYVLNNDRQSLNISIKMPLTANSVSNLNTVDFALKTSVSSQISPDGAKKVIMEKTVNDDNTQTYTFYTADTEDNLDINKKLIFTKILEATKSMSVPFNTWSPDNKYFFVHETAKEGNNILVFNALGTPFPNQEKYLNTAADQATGWASETLIIINRGSSYWFEVPSKTLIPLSEDF